MAISTFTICSWAAQISAAACFLLKTVSEVSEKSGIRDTSATCFYYCLRGPCAVLLKSGVLSFIQRQRALTCVFAGMGGTYNIKSEVNREVGV